MAEIEQLASPNWRARKQAVEALAQADDAAAAQAVLDILRIGHNDLGALNAALQLISDWGTSLAPRLVALLADPDPETRMYVILALGSLGEAAGSAGVVPALLAALDDDDTRVRFNAIEALGKLRARPAVEALEELLQTKDFNMAFPAIQALADIGDPHPVPTLLELLQDDLLGAEAALALGQLGGALPPTSGTQAAPQLSRVEVAEALLAWLESPRGEAPAATIALAVLVTAGDSGNEADGDCDQFLVQTIGQHLSLPGLEKLLAAIPDVEHLRLSSQPEAGVTGTGQSEDAFLEGLARLLGWWLCAGSLPEPAGTSVEEVTYGLLSLLHQAAARPAAESALAASSVRGATAALSGLLERLVDPDREVRLAAARLLAKQMPAWQEAAAGAGLPAAGAAGPADTGGGPESLASKDVAPLDAALLAALDAALESLDDELAILVVEALGQAGQPQVFEHLVERLEPAPPAVRRALALVLFRLESRMVSSGLGMAYLAVYDRTLALLEPTRPGAVREAAAMCLGLLLRHGEAGAGAAEAGTALLRALDDPAPAVQRAALEGMAHWEDPRLLPALAGAAHRGDPGLRVAAVRALAGPTAARKPEAALPMLLDLLEDHDLWVRRAACQSLGALAKLWGGAGTGGGDSGGQQSLAPNDIIGMIAARLEDDAPPVRMAAALALGDSAAPQAAAALRQHLEDADPDVRAAVRTALARLGPAQLDPQAPPAD